MRFSLVKWPLLVGLTLLAAACGKSDGHDDPAPDTELRNQLEQAKKDQAALTAEDAAAKKERDDAKAAAADADKKRAAAETTATDADKKRAAAEAAAAKAKDDALASVRDTLSGRRAARAEEVRDNTINATRAAREAEAGRIAFVGKSFAGIWLSDGDEQYQLSKGCYLMMRVSASPAQLVRAILCDNGTLETSVAPIISVTTEASRFSGGFQFTANLGPAVTSCPSNRVSTFPSQTALAFDAKTGSGSEVALYAYTMMGDQEVAMHSGGDVDSLGRNKDCDVIVKRAASAGDSADDMVLKLAAKVCQVEAQKAGCYTASGFQPQ